ncbi:MAG TPA: phage exclusion protein Lit family protein [Nevskia sp.]|nr:phage exclusion protein Lit family protein [Nevskia sp.]
MGARRSRDAYLLADWALKKVHNKQGSDWPTNLPRPNLRAAIGSDVNLANELYLKAIAFVMFHEFAHIKLGHSQNTGSAALPNEEAADRFAADWILTRAAGPRVLEARALGIASAILTFYRFEQMLENKLIDHPHPMMRLETCFSEYVDDRDNNVLGLAALLVQVHGTLVSGEKLFADEKTYGELLAEFQFSVSRAKRRRPHNIGG